MRHWIRKIHMYAGLLSFTALLVYGIAGLTATFEDAPENRGRPQPAVRYLPFEARAGASDKEVADAVYRLVNPSLAAPVPAGALRRNEAAELRLNFYSPNGIVAVTFLEREKRLRVETRRNRLWRFLSNLHAGTAVRGERDARLRLWALYNQLAMAALLVLAVTGVWLWLQSRPRYRPAPWSLALGAGAFVLLYVLTR